jgi:hypothetical protein
MVGQDAAHPRQQTKSNILIFTELLTTLATAQLRRFTAVSALGE